MATSDYSYNVFINCPFDDEYKSIRNAIIFAIFDCGFTPRCALEEDDSGNVRINKIQKIIEESKFGIHDISRTEIGSNNLPRLNMAFELGIFLGAKRFGDKHQKTKVSLILDRDEYRYQAFISDISGQDIKPHSNSPEEAIKCIRNWLNSKTGRKTIMGGRQIIKRYQNFCEDLPQICREVNLDEDEMTYNDYSNFVEEWLKEDKLQEMLS